jgi:hypothetical protein
MEHLSTVIEYNLPLMEELSFHSRSAEAQSFALGVLELLNLC